MPRPAGYPGRPSLEDYQRWANRIGEIYAILSNGHWPNGGRWHETDRDDLVRSLRQLERNMREYELLTRGRRRHWTEHMVAAGPEVSRNGVHRGRMYVDPALEKI